MPNRTAGNALPEPPNPAPAPFSGPPPTTGSGRTAFFVPTFVGPNADAEWDEVTAHGAVGGATLEAPAVHNDPFLAASEELTVPRGGSFGGAATGTRRQMQPLDDPIQGPDAPAYGSVADQEVDPYSPTVQYDDDQQAEWDQQALDDAGGVPATTGPGANRRGASSLRPPSTMRGPRSGRVSAAGRGARASGVDGPPKKPKNPMVIAGIVIAVIAVVGAGIYFGVVAPGNTPSNNATANGDNVNIRVENTSTPDNPGNGSGNQPTSGKYVFTWESEPTNVTVAENADGETIWVTRESNVRARLNVTSPWTVVRVMLGTEEIATPEAKEFSIDLNINADDVVTENQVLRCETKGGRPGTFEFKLAFDDTLPTVTLTSPVTTPGQPLITSERRLSVRVRVTDNYLLKEVTVVAANRRNTVPVAAGSITETINQQLDFPGDGSFTLMVTADDMAGNKQTFSQEVIVDSQRPTVSFDGQAADARAWNVGSERVILSGRAEDLGSGVRELTINGDTVGLNRAGGTATFRWQSNRLQPGQNRVPVVAIDRAGNRASFDLILTFSPDQPPQFVQMDLGGTKVWSSDRPGDTPPASLQYEGSGTRAQIEMFFDAYSRAEPEVTVNGRRITEVSGNGTQWQFEAEVPFTGEETEIEIHVRTSMGTEATVSFTILRTPWPAPAMPLYRMEQLTLDAAFPPSGNSDLEPDQLAVDFAPGADGSVAILTAGGQVIEFSGDGEELHTYDLPDAAAPDSLRRAGSYLVARTATGELVAFDTRSDHVVQPPGIQSTPGSDWCGVDDHRVAVQGLDGSIIVVDLAGSAPLVFPAPGRPVGPLVSVAGRYLLLGRGGVTALSLTLRRPVWSSPAPVTDIEVSADGTIVLAEASGRVRAIKGFGSDVIAEIDGVFAEGAQVALWSGGMVAVGRPLDGDEWTWQAHAGSPDGAATTFTGVLPESLRSGPGGSLWCMTNGYVCRITIGGE